MTIAENDVAAWTQNAEFWIDMIRQRRDRYRNELTDQAMLDAVGEVRNKSVLDAGCGEGYLTRAVERRGAAVAGVDSCQPLVDAAIAEGKRSGGSTAFYNADLRDLPFAGGHFDLVLSNHSLNEVIEPGDALAEWARVLRPGGRVVALMLHPCFFAWRPANENQSVYGPRVGAEPYDVAGFISPAIAEAKVGTLETYADAFTSNGFVIERISEPRPSRAMVESDPWWAARSRLPKFLLMAGRLPKQGC